MLNSIQVLASDDSHLYAQEPRTNHKQIHIIPHRQGYLYFGT